MFCPSIALKILEIKSLKVVGKIPKGAILVKADVELYTSISHDGGLEVF